MRLGYDRARTLIKQYTGLHLNQLRHSAATHLGEKGPTQCLLAFPDIRRIIQRFTC
jgi:hypothetical protein